MTKQVLFRAGLVLVCAWGVSCGGSAPSASTPAPTPTPVVQATPTPTPFPGSIGAFACKIPPSVGNTNVCPILKPQFSDVVNAAIDRTLNEHPELFNFNDLAGSSPRVLDQQKYLTAVASNLVQAGYCTVIEKEEIAVKNSNDFNEQWNVYAAAGFVRRKYVTTCSPSWF